MIAARARRRVVGLTLAASVALAGWTGSRLTAQAVRTGTTGRISGQVVTFDDAGAPVRRAIVMLGGGVARNRSVVTDDNGRFEFAELPAGQFTVTASRPAFVPAAYGAKAPGRPGTPLQLGPGQQLADVTLRMARGAVITGTVRDDRGQPVPGAQIVVMHARRLTMAAGGGPATINSDIVTDDLGIYRVHSLAPGAYLVGAGRSALGAIGRLSAQQTEAALVDLERRGRGGPLPASSGNTATNPPNRNVSTYGVAASYFPGTANIWDAAPIVVAAGEERAGVNLVLAPVNTSTIEGVVTPAGGALVTLSSARGAVGLPLNFTQPSLNAQVGADGRFVFRGIMPGSYVITARTTAAVANRPGGAMLAPSVQASDAWLWAGAEVSVDGTDISGLDLGLQPAPHLSGRLRFDASSGAPPQDLTAARVRLSAPSDSPLVMVNGVMFGRAGISPASVRPDGTFEFPGVFPGLYRLTATVPGGAWWLRSATVNDIDVLDTLLTVSSATNVDGLTLTFTDRRTELSGTLQTPSGTPATDYFVIAFTTDAALWQPNGRRLASTRPATNGLFSMRDLPPGDYYLAALTDLDPDEWQTTAFLSQAAATAVRVTIGTTGQTRQDLRIAR